MHFDWWTFALQLVNFAVLVWLLHRFLYRPVLRMIDARQEAVAKQYDDAAAADVKAKAGLASIDKARAGIAIEREEALKSAAMQAEKTAKERIGRAEEEAASLIDNARKSLAAEREQAFDTARRLAVDLGADMARRLLDAIPLSLRAEAWLEHIETHLKSLSSEERLNIAQSREVTVVTAALLPDEAKLAWTRRLHAMLGETLAISFAVDSHIIAGAELHFPNVILRFSWQSMVTALRHEIENHGHAG